MWSSKVKPHLKRNAVAYAIFVVAMLGGIIALAISSFLFPKKQEPAEAESKISAPTVDEALTTLRRASPNALQICWDSGVDGYLYQFEDKGTLKWWYVKNRQMWKSENGTWMSKPVEDSEWVLISPDATGLKCSVKQ